MQVHCTLQQPAKWDTVETHPMEPAVVSEDCPEKFIRLYVSTSLHSIALKLYFKLI